jgi:hypothetical protein
MTKIISIVGGMQPSAPTIGTATAGDTTASVTFTASSYIGKGTITYTATSSPGNFTATGSSSPLTVTGLTNGTAYTFTVVGNTDYGVASVASAASNSITPAALGDFQSIATYTVSGTSTTVLTFSSIPSTYKHLQIRGMVRNSVSAYYQTILMRFNASSGGTDYNGNILRGNGATAEMANYINNAQAYVEMSYVAGGNTTTGTFSPLVLDLYDYTDTSKKRNGKLIMGYENNGIGFDNYDKGLQTAQYWNWQQTNAINQIELTINGGYYIAGTRLALYGIKG